MTASYAQPDGTPYCDREVKSIEEVKADLLSGRRFYLVANSARSAVGYRPILNRRDWAHCTATLARMAAESDSMARLAFAIIGSINLYGTRPSATANVYDAAAQAVEAGYVDVVSRSAPDAGRRRSYERDYSLRERVLLCYWLAEATAPMADHVPGVGWCVDAIAGAEGFHLRAGDFPSLNVA